MNTPIIAFGHNGAEVHGTVTHRVTDSQGRYMYDSVLSPEQIAQNIAADRRVEAVMEWECKGCETVVDSPDGHDEPECREAAFIKNEDRLADYR